MMIDIGSQYAQNTHFLAGTDHFAIDDALHLQTRRWIIS
jgi:hypothetical protein